MDSHAINFMQRALELARKGTALASPNPMVGCVLVREGQVVGEGFHQYEWRDHAEIVAIKSAGEQARGATMYVTLEPCNHTGRTGPCTAAILEAGIRRVVAATVDPNPRVAGTGFAKLRDAGVEVFTGVEEEAARKLNESFGWWISTKKPLVALKSAITLDGQLALPRGPVEKNRKKKFEWFTSEESREEVHRMRHDSDALLTGIGTVLADDPLLTDRSGLPRRRRLLRVVLDSKLRLPVKSRIVRTSEDDLLVFTLTGLATERAKKLQQAGVEVVKAKPRQGRIDLANVIAELGRREMLSVLLEAGSKLNGAALTADVVDKVVLFYAPKISGETRVPFVTGKSFRHTPLREMRIEPFGRDLKVEAYLHDVYGNY